MISGENNECDGSSMDRMKAQEEENDDEEEGVTRRQLYRYYILNRKRDKANKTLSGRRFARKQLWRTKTWNKSPHFCSSPESFSNYGREARGRRRTRDEATQE